MEKEISCEREGKERDSKSQRDDEGNESSLLKHKNDPN